jgi:lipoprotein-releasing system ATP-binding protein
MNDMSHPLIEVTNLSKSYIDGTLSVDVLHSLSLNLAQGERLAIVGQSGSGKSTLLHILGALDEPSEGKVLIKGQDIHQLSAKAQGQFRNKHLGFVYQFHHLLAEFTALENVAMTLLIGGESPASARKKATDLITRVGLKDRIEHKPGELSGGERQRISLARALVNQPDCVLADEPTGNLDEQTANETYDLMLELNQSLETSFIVVTHDKQLAKRMDRTLLLTAGHLEQVESTDS